MTDREHGEHVGGENGGRSRGRDRDRRSDQGRRRYHSRHRKERVLHTRISEQLADDIRQMAEELRVPVSNLVRNVLEEAFSVVESVSDDVGDLLEDVIEQAERASDRLRHFRRRRGEWVDPEEERHREDDEEPQAFEEIEAWQPVILNATRRCDGDGREMRRGEQAFLGLTASGLSDTYLCPPCVEARKGSDAAG